MLDDLPEGRIASRPAKASRRSPWSNSRWWWGAGAVVVIASLFLTVRPPGDGRVRAKVDEGLGYPQSARRQWSTPDGEPRGALSIKSAEAHVALVRRGSGAIRSWLRDLRTGRRELLEVLEREEEIARDLEFGLRALSPLGTHMVSGLDGVRQSRLKAKNRLTPEAEPEDLEEVARRLEGLLVDLAAAQRSVEQMAHPKEAVVPGRGERYRLALFAGLELDLEQERLLTEDSVSAAREAHHLLSEHLRQSRVLLDQVDGRVAVLAAFSQEIVASTADVSRAVYLVDRYAQDETVKTLSGGWSLVATAHPEIPDLASLLERTRLICRLVTSLEQDAKESAGALTSLSAASRSFQAQGPGPRRQLRVIQDRLPAAVAALNSLVGRMDELTLAAGPVHTLWGNLLALAAQGTNNPWREPVSVLSRLTEFVTVQESELRALPQTLRNLQESEQEYRDRLTALRARFGGTPQLSRPGGVSKRRAPVSPGV